jgi:hypothetical protein
MSGLLNRWGAKATCSRLWQVEAARDGRLSLAAKETFERHVERCADCRREVDIMNRLGRDLRALEMPVDEIALRRLREGVLARSDAEVAGRSVPPRRTSAGRARLVVSGLAVAVLLALFVTRHVSKKATDETSSVAPKTTVDAIDEGGARWTRHAEGEVERVDLEDGTLRLRVHRLPGGKRVIVRVPDGEIEDQGTVFHVVVRNGVTQRVGVDEGRVTVRLRSAATLTLSSGETWERSEESHLAESRPAERAIAAAAPAAPPIPASSPSPRTTPSEVAQHHLQTSPPSTSALSSAKPSPQADEEDAAYLNAIQLLRSGRASDAKLAAREYLRRFPDGFRREEMGRLTR